MSNSQIIELLAPAKNLEVGLRAIDAGADAVYIGGPSFGARKAAGNSLDDIAQLCRYAHLFHAQVLVTLNTLLHEDEYAEAVRLAHAYKKIGVDAIIIQDLRLAEMLFESGEFPRANGSETNDERHCTWLHASTQCDNRNLERVQELEAMGFRRVVLARELTYDEIAHIRANTSCQLEAFVHGALCVSYSGACYLSEAVCGRSANRGECAQMCRLAYDVLDENRHELLHQKHILSLRDLDRSGSLGELLATGVTTLKIEGRLKDADYVTNVVAYYRLLLDRLIAEQPERYQRASYGICRRTFTPNPEKTFHRGATEYFAFGRPDHLVNMDTPKSTGELLGYAPIDTRMLHNGDGITFAGEGFYWPNNRVRIPAGTAVYRNYDAEFQRQLSQRDAVTRHLPVRLHFEETPCGCRLTIAPDTTNVPLSSLHTQPSTLDSPLASIDLPLDKQPAQNAERAEAVVRQQLSKLGGTPLEATDVLISWSQPLFLPAAVLNDLRRQAVDAFLQSLSTPSSLDSPLSTRDTQPSSLDSPLSSNAPIVNPLMTCRYCILHELGCCKTRHPRREGIPTYLRQGNLLLRITTDCARCQMTLTRA